MVSDQTDRINLLPYLEYLPDSAHTLSFEEIRQTADSTWRQAPRDRENLNFGYTDDVYWFRFQLQNTTNNNQETKIEELSDIVFDSSLRDGIYGSK